MAVSNCPMSASGSVTGDPTYDPACDLNSDGSVDVMNLLMLADNRGK